MPTLLTWEYVGGNEGSAEALLRGTQRIYAGDAVHDDVFSRS